MVSVFCPLMPSCNTYHLTWVSLSWAWSIPSRLLQQSTASAPYLDEGYLLTATVPDLQRGIAPLGPPGLFQILKDDAVKLLHSICQQIWKTRQWLQDWKTLVFVPISKKGNAKECSNYHTMAIISHAGKVKLKILQARLQQYVNHVHPDVQAEFRKGRGTRGQIVNIH